MRWSGASTPGGADAQAVSSAASESRYSRPCELPGRDALVVHRGQPSGQQGPGDLQVAPRRRAGEPPFDLDRSAQTLALGEADDPRGGLRTRGRRHCVRRGARGPGRLQDGQDQQQQHDDGEGALPSVEEPAQVGAFVSPPATSHTGPSVVHLLRPRRCPSSRAGPPERVRTP
ncbi:MAG: hypothetical protein ACKO04_11200 [Actinomycetes bacterium]